MIYDLLDIIEDPSNPGQWIFSNKSESLLYALIGFVVVFAGICIIILIVWLIGLLMRKTNNLACLTKAGREARRAAPEGGVVIERPDLPAEEPMKSSGAISDAVIEKYGPPDDIPDEVKAAIVAAITAYYTEADPECEFVVRRIRRL
ncbi:MAG: OadG family protein [Clostridia bacterium]|nr:OadG family protein [Clostridia bacterium]